MNFNDLIFPIDLRKNISEPDLVVLDCRFDLKDPGAGQSRYLEGHIAGAHYVDLNRDLCGPITEQSGRHPLASVSQLEKLFSEAGVTEKSQVVCYDDGDSSFAARCWWTLRYLGHERVAVLDGGWKAWTFADGPVTRETPAKRNSNFKARLQTGWLVTISRLNDHRLIDSRDAVRFRGEQEPIDPVAGHIPGAKNLPYKTHLNSHGSFRSKAEIQKEFKKFGEGPHTFYCGSGVTACVNILAAHYAGISKVNLYLGSWSEWIRDPNRPIAKGD